MLIISEISKLGTFSLNCYFQVLHHFQQDLMQHKLFFRFSLEVFDQDLIEGGLSFSFLFPLLSDFELLTSSLCWSAVGALSLFKLDELIFRIRLNV